MYAHRGNSKGYRERRRPQPTQEQSAVYIAESVRARRAEGRPYTTDEYGLTHNVELLEHVARALGVIR